MREIAETLAVLDRVVDGTFAVLIVGDPPEREVTVGLDQLPDDVAAGDWLRLQLEGDRIVSAHIDTGATEAARSRVRSKMEQLRQRGRRLK